MGSFGPSDRVRTSRVRLDHQQVSHSYAVSLTTTVHYHANLYLAELYITAQFRVGDPSYEWMLLFLVWTRQLASTGVNSHIQQTSEKVWRRTRDFSVSAKSSARKWSIDVGNKEDAIEGDASYEPTFGTSQLFRWKGHWFEVRNQSPDSLALDRPPWSPHQGPSQTGFIHLT